MRLAPGGHIAIVTGSRNGIPAAMPSTFVMDALNDFEHQFGRIEHIIEGGCRPRRKGDPATIDQLAAQWAMRNERPFTTFPAPWNSWEALELPSKTSAGPHRNSWQHDLACMLAPTTRNRRCLAFPGGDGTASMVRIAVERGTPTYRYEHAARDTWTWQAVSESG